MFPTGLVSTLKRIISPGDTSSPGPFTLKSLDGFPYTDWTQMQEMYSEYQRWYSGASLDEQIVNETTGETVDKYPIHINPIPNTCEKHTVVLLGNTLESIRQGNLPIRFTIQNKDKAKRNAEDTNLEIISDALIESFKEHGSGAMFASNGIISQYHGGCVFGVSYEVDSSSGETVKQVKVFAPLPTEFIGIPDAKNPWLMREAWFIQEISKENAEAYGIVVEPLETKWYYIEHWTPEQYSVKINDQTVSILVDGKKFVYDRPNPYGMVPFVYIPHIRVRGFYGESIINKTIKGLIKEMNLRFADTGDAISDDSHSSLIGRNIRDSVTNLQLPDGKKAINIGGATGLGAGEKDPEIYAVNTKSASEPMLKFGEKLENLYRKEARHPAVADGEDEGSQRSSLTLTTRMWPLVAHVELERINWTTGLIKLAKIILVMCERQGVYGITKDHIDNYETNIKWALTLPRDRDELVNEVAIRKKNNLGSLYHLISLFDDVEDVDAEVARIEENIEKEAARAQKQSDSANGPTTSDKDPSADEPGASARNFIKQE